MFVSGTANNDVLGEQTVLEKGIEERVMGEEGRIIGFAGREMRLLNCFLCLTSALSSKQLGKWGTQSEHNTDRPLYTHHQFEGRKIPLNLIPAEDGLTGKG